MPGDDIYWGSPKTHKDKWNTMMFHKTILDVFETSEEMLEEENRLIKPVYKTDPHCLNENFGGRINYTPEVRKKMKDFASERIHSSETKQKLSSRHSGQNNPFHGRKHSVESLRKQKESFSEIEHNKGSKNPMFGKMWITNGLESYRINKNDSIPEGYRKGRVIKSSI